MVETNKNETVFYKKYTEFCDDLMGACPEYTSEVAKAKALSNEERAKQYILEVLTVKDRDLAGNPGTVLPGVKITDSVWAALSAGSRKAILDYLRILDLSSVYMHVDVSGVEQVSQEWVDSILREWRGKLDRVDFNSISEKFMSMFGTQGANLPPLPDKFLKGKMAKLAEDMVREFKPEDFGLTAEEIAACETDPTRAFEILMQASSQNPERLQGVMMRVAKKLQSKIQSGELKPQELAAEAEELMKEFQTHPAFVEMMESFRSAFSFEEPEAARRSGHDGEGRLAIARARLRKKMEEKKAGRSGKK
jgi:hypothetical protein